MIWYVIPMAILHLISISFILLKFVRSPELFLSKLFLNTKTTDHHFGNQLFNMGDTYNDIVYSI